MAVLKSNLRLLVVVSAAVVVLAVWAKSAAADPAEFQRIISEQISAFRADDGGKAFSFAAPGIRHKFARPDIFMQMVRSGYAAVYRPRSFTFGPVTEEMGRPTQRVRIVDEEGGVWTALYAFEQQADGSWLISGVMLVREKGAEV